MSRRVKDLPKHFVKAKVEVDKLMNLYWSNKLNSSGKRDETIENVALLYIMLQELSQFTEHHFFNQGNQLLEMMDQLKQDKVTLAEYGKTIDFDKEANWLYIRDMDSSEWKSYDEECNNKFLNKE